MSQTNAAFPDRTVTCWCGCGGRTKSRFVQGHDSKFHSTIKKVLRGELDAETELAKLPHDEARAEFHAFADRQQPKEDARNAKLAEKAATKAQEAATKAATKAAELQAKLQPKTEDEPEHEDADHSLTA